MSFYRNAGHFLAVLVATMCGLDLVGPASSISSIQAEDVMPIVAGVERQRGDSTADGGDGVCRRSIRRCLQAEDC